MANSTNPSKGSSIKAGSTISPRTHASTIRKIATVASMSSSGVPGVVASTSSLSSSITATSDPGDPLSVKPATPVRESSAVTSTPSSISLRDDSAAKALPTANPATDASLALSTKIALGVTVPLIAIAFFILVFVYMRREARRMDAVTSRPYRSPKTPHRTGLTSQQTLQPAFQSPRGDTTPQTPQRGNPKESEEWWGVYELEDNDMISGRKVRELPAERFSYRN